MEAQIVVQQILEAAQGVVLEEFLVETVAPAAQVSFSSNTQSLFQL